MSWTYGEPADANRDAVRFLSGQNSSADDQLVSDEEIAWALGQRSSNVYGAAALVCEGLASRYAQEPESEKVGQLGLTFGNRADHFRKRAKELQLEMAYSGVNLYVGGRSKSDKRADETDTDRFPPAFAIGFMDHPQTVTLSTST